MFGVIQQSKSHRQGTQQRAPPHNIYDAQTLAGAFPPKNNFVAIISSFPKNLRRNVRNMHSLLWLLDKRVNLVVVIGQGFSSQLP